MSYDPGSHTIEEVQGYLAEHPEERDAVLAAEQARGDQARSTLVASLSEPPPEPPLEGGTPEPPLEEEVVDIDAGHPHGEYPEEGTFGYGDKSMAEADAQNLEATPE